MSLPPDTVVPKQQMFEEALGVAPARGRLRGRRIIVVGAGQRATVDERPPVGAPLPFGRQGTAWEVAYATLFLISNESSYVNAHALVVDGGLAGGIARATR
jgi:NAD(P)-dependent dehydrogenase (short-subunit alcohol dehydrogenase family)